MFDGKTLIRRLFIAICTLSLLGCSSSPSRKTGAMKFTLAGARTSGTADLSPTDLLRGLDLQVGDGVAWDELLAKCNELENKKAFNGFSCGPRVDGKSIWLDLAIRDVPVPPLIFDNFVWTSRAALIARVKRQVPLFTPQIPYESTLNVDVIKALNRILSEDGVKGTVDHPQFWISRGMNVFVVEGITVPVVACAIEGENAPSSADVQRWAHVADGWTLSIAELNWRLGFAVRDLYNSRGYLHPSVQEPRVQFLGKSGGKFPVKVIIRISSGPQYTFRSVNFAGRAKAHEGQLLSEWQLKPGDIYNDSYTSEFESNRILDQPWAQKDGTSSLTSSSCVVIDESGRSVSLTITVGLPKHGRGPTDSSRCAQLDQFFFFPGNYVDGDSGAI